MVSKDCCAAWVKKCLLLTPDISLLQEWCKENFVNGRNMMLVSDVRAQLRDICVKVIGCHTVCHTACHTASPVCIFLFVSKLILLCTKSQE